MDINDKCVVDETVIEDILSPVRDEDKGDDLWTVFNICQEKLIKGGFLNKTQKDKMRRVKSITSIKKNMDYNQRLWLSASKYLETAK
jgi:hypothetical protein